MLFHTDKLSIYHFANAAHEVNANLGKYSKHGSQIRKAKFNITFSYPLSETRESATWNQVGCILAQLFEIDPEMFVGSGSISQGTLFYDGKEDFHDKTGSNFVEWKHPFSKVNPLDPDNCTLHKWDHVRDGIYNHLQCRKCGIHYFQNGSLAVDPHRR